MWKIPSPGGTLPRRTIKEPKWTADDSRGGKHNPVSREDNMLISQDPALALHATRPNSGSNTRYPHVVDSKYLWFYTPLHVRLARAGLLPLSFALCVLGLVSFYIIVLFAALKTIALCVLREIKIFPSRSLVFNTDHQPQEWIFPPSDSMIALKFRCSVRYRASASGAGGKRAGRGRYFSCFLFPSINQSP